jgi:3D (Asp-Asp-Asp) domain-containing protein
MTRQHHHATPRATWWERDNKVGAATAFVKDSIRYLSELIDRIVSGIKSTLPLVAAVACSSADAEEPPPTPAPKVVAPVVEAAPAPKQVKEQPPKPIGDFSITFYYVVTEEEVVPKKKPPVVANDNQSGQPIDKSDPELASIVTPQDQVTIYETGCEPIADVSRDFATALAVQGTGKLKDGRVVNIWGHCACGHSPCFKVTAAQWGTGGTGRQLQPFRTVAVDPKMIKLGSLLHVPFLEGRLMPGRAPWGGYVHDGCVVADDVGGGIKGTQLDLFVGRRGWFLGMSGREGSHEWAKSVAVFDGSKLCERKNHRVARKAGAI